MWRQMLLSPEARQPSFDRNMKSLASGTFDDSSGGDASKKNALPPLRTLGLIGALSTAPLIGDVHRINRV